MTLVVFALFFVACMATAIAAYKTESSWPVVVLLAADAGLFIVTFTALAFDLVAIASRGAL